MTKKLNLYSVNVILCGTLYVKAATKRAARKIVRENVYKGVNWLDDMRDQISDRDFKSVELPDISFSPAMTPLHPVGGKRFVLEETETDVPAYQDDDWVDGVSDEDEGD